jgi:tetrapyrrole methylase family protein / MazG family protein
MTSSGGAGDPKSLADDTADPSGPGRRESLRMTAVCRESVRGHNGGMPEIQPSPAAAEAGGLFARFVELIARLRAPGGCPWDREQTHESVKPMTIEEAYEVAHAIDEGDDEELLGELGDLLLQVVFHANIAEERGAFRMKQVLERVSDKMVRRHPHVFGEDGASTSGEVLRSWEAIKAREREAKGKDDESMLDSVHKGLPAVMEAFQMTTKVARVGFDWKVADAALVKLDEEVAELREAIAGRQEAAKVAEEVGDLLFIAVNVARLAGVDPESALKAANRKFRRRFRHVEERLRADGREPADSSLEEMDRLWDEAKARGL